LNVDLNDDQWIQASLPVGDGGLGIRSAQILAPSVFLASAASTLQLQQSILPDNIRTLSDESIESTDSIWTNLSNSSTPAVELHHIQKAWDGRIVEKQRSLIFSRASSDVDKARLLAVSSPHAGDWLQRVPIPTPVHGCSTGECGLLPEHYDHRIKRRCSH